MPLIDEHGLEAFRRDRLSVPALLELIERHVWMLLRLALGAGKSFAVDALLAAAETYGRFDLVVYIAPTWNIIRERVVCRAPNSLPVKFLIVEPRPVERCGEYAEEWARMEKRGCAALAKETLCKACRAHDPDPCGWPLQLRRLNGVQLVVMTEQQLLLNRSMLLLLRSRTEARRALVIFDEANVLDAPYEVTISSAAQKQMVHVLKEIASRRPEAAVWLASMHALVECPRSAIAKLQLRFPPKLLYATSQLQRIGTQQFGDEFRFIGYDLVQLAHSRRKERHLRADGSVVFTARPYLKAHMLVTSAFLNEDYVAHRLRTDRIESPFSDVEVRHSGTRIVNLQHRSGAVRYFDGNRERILDTFALLIRRNVNAGRTTTLVCRKRLRKSCAQYLVGRLAQWGIVVEIRVDGDRLPTTPDPCVIPMLHYGILGTNDYEFYESVYCLCSYYISDATLTRALLTLESDVFGIGLRIVSRDTQVRRVELADSDPPGVDKLWLANLYLRRLEVAPVLQVAGRVRFATRPREVVLFQMADFRSELGDIEVVDSLADLRRAFNLPDPDDLDDEVALAHIEAGVSQGLTVADAAAQAGVSRRTAFRLRKRARSAKSHQIYSLMRFGTPDGQGGAT